MLRAPVSCAPPFSPVPLVPLCGRMARLRLALSLTASPFPPMTLPSRKETRACTSCGLSAMEKVCFCVSGIYQYPSRYRTPPSGHVLVVLPRVTSTQTHISLVMTVPSSAAIFSFTGYESPCIMRTMRYPPSFFWRVRSFFAYLASRSFISSTMCTKSPRSCPSRRLSSFSLTARSRVT